MTTIFETERLYLRYFRESDLPTFFEYRNDADVSLYQTWPEVFTEKMLTEFWESQQDLTIQTKDKWLQIAFEEKSSGSHIGDCAICVRKNQTEIGYTIAQQFQRKGYATEGITGLLSVLFGMLKLHRVYAITDIDNLASINLLEKLGFRREGHSLKSYYDEKMKEWRDELYFAILRDEWERNS